MANERIGRAPCPLCRKPAGVTVSKSHLVVLTCNGCNCQLFTRSDTSDGLLRNLLLPPPVEPVEPITAAPPVEPDPLPVAVPQETAPPPAPPDATKQKSVWDIYS